MRLRSVTLISLLCFLVLGLNAKHFWTGDQMNISQVKQHWGCEALNESAFKNSKEDIKAKMTCSLLKNQDKYLGKSVTEIRSIFGSPDGFYYKDIFPAYLIQTGKDRSESSWQIVFLLNSKRKVTEIIVHKNCCY